MSLLSWFSNRFDNHNVAVGSVDRMIEKSGGGTWSLKEALLSPLKATAAAVSAVLSVPEMIAGYIAETALGAQRAITEAPTGAVFEGFRQVNSRLAPKIWNAPSSIFGWVRSGLKKIYE